jgi:hypothetical protein
MFRYRRAVHQPPRFDSAFLRIATATDDNSIVFGPFWRITVRIFPNDVREKRSQQLVAFELGSNLPQEGFGNRPRIRKDPDRDLGIIEYILDGEGESYNRTLVVFASP